MADAKEIGARMRALFEPGMGVLITGGTSGIGAAIAAGFAAVGANVAATGLTEQDLAEAEACAGVTHHKLDMQNQNGIDTLVAGLPRLDAVVCCAGMAFQNGEELDPAHFATVLAVNLTGTMRVCTAARPRLAEQGGAIVTLASMNSIFGAPRAPGYAASKGGIVQLTKSLAIAWARNGIRVNAIAPGGIETRLSATVRASEQANRKVLERTPLRRWGQPADIVGAALFLCSPAAAFVTGSVVTVDGGYSAV